MIELPETFTLARQMKDTLPGSRIEHVVVNQSPLKFAFFKPSVDQIANLLTSRTIMDVTHNHRNWLQIELDQDALDLGEMGGRILLHESAQTIPPKHQLLLELSDHRFLTISIALWGFIHAVQPGDERGYGTLKSAPLDDDFTFDRFQSLFSHSTVNPKTRIKYFLISQPGLGGVGNGCLQDILFNAGIHPKRMASSLNQDGQQTLYSAIQSTLRQMIDLGGRDCEHDLYNQPGGYKTILGSHALEKPCPCCGTAIERISFLGGASYFCPHCQV